MELAQLAANSRTSFRAGGPRGEGGGPLCDAEFLLLSASVLGYFWAVFLHVLAAASVFLSVLLALQMPLAGPVNIRVDVVHGISAFLFLAVLK